MCVCIYIYIYIYIYINSQEHLSEKPTFNFLKTRIEVKIDETDDAWKKKKTILASYVLQQNLEICKIFILQIYFSVWLTE